MELIIEPNNMVTNTSCYCGAYKGDDDCNSYCGAYKGDGDCGYCGAKKD